MTEAPPYAHLSPDLILDAVEALGFRVSGHTLALNSFENRVFQIGVEDRPPLIAKFYRPKRWTTAQILEEHAFAQALADAEIPVVAPLVINGSTLHAHAGFSYALFPRRGGRTPELDRRAVREWIGRFLGRIHALGATLAYCERPTLSLDTFGHVPRDWLLASGMIPDTLREVWASVSQQALDGVARAFERAGEVRTIRLHGDLHAGNLLWTDAGPHFVDLDDSRMGPAMQDFWMLLSGDRAAQQEQLLDLLAGYEDFAEFEPRELHLLEALRTLRLIHYSHWLASRWSDPAFPIAFPWFAETRFWEGQILALREQIALMDEPPLRI
jgi:Ser/Thr protein kinase RdoA (MazF antagonist)